VKSACTASGFVVVRTPLLAFDELEVLGAQLAAAVVARVAPTELEAALAADRARQVGRLRELAARPEVREALHLASPSLDDSLETWLARPDADGDGDAKVVRALFRYVARMAARATPFALFAGVSVGRVAEVTRLSLGPRVAVRTHACLDVAFVVDLTRALHLHPGLGPDLVPEPSVTDDDAIARLLAALRRLAPEADAVPELSDWIAELETAERALAALTAAPPGRALTAWRSVVVALADLPERIAHAALRRGGHVPPGDKRARALDRVARADGALFDVLTRGLEARAARDRRARVVQVDMIKASPTATLGRAVLDEVRRGAELLHRIVPPSDSLAAFTAAFTARHGDAEVPLLETIDDDHGLPVPPATGLTAPEPLLRDLPFADAPPALRFGPREAYLLERLQDTVRATRAGDTACLELDDDDLVRLAVDAPRPLPGAFAVLASLAADSDAALAAGRFRVRLAGVVGPSGATLLGRFCHADPALAAHVAAHLRAEEALRPDAIHAEVAFLPDGPDGNVARRPALRAYHIAVGDRAAAAREGRIEFADLRLSVVDGRLVLRSHRLGREVLPRLMSAHNYRDLRHPAVYRLLGALQHEGTAGPLAFSWGALDGAPVLPRVTSGRLVLSRARWRLGRTRLVAIARLGSAAGFAAVQRLRDELALPRWVGLVEGDRELLLDLDSPLAVDELVARGRTRDAIVLVEPFPPPDALVVRGPDGRYVHELVVPFVVGAATAERRPAPPPRNDVPRRLLPGSSWLYAKLYTTPAAADDLLRTVVRPVVAETDDSWFFVRYADPDFHLRVRFHGDPRALLGNVVPALHAAAAPAVAAGQLIRLQFDTYEREVERYGGPDGIELAERLFHADSEAALGWISDHALTADDSARWRVALVGIDRLLDDLGVALVDRDCFAASQRDDLQRRLRADVTLLRAIGDRFRAERPSLDHPLADAVFARRSSALRVIVDELRHRERAGRLTRSVAELTRSYVHLSANRMARTYPLEQELVLYSFLSRLYRTRLARG
jgi:thiopeptide-type bacteriocin biosynthesis protein